MRCIQLRRARRARRFISRLIGFAGLVLVAGGCVLAPHGTRDERAQLAAAGAPFVAPVEERIVPPLPDDPDWRDLLRHAFLVNGELEAAYFDVARGGRAHRHRRRLSEHQRLARLRVPVLGRQPEGLGSHHAVGRLRPDAEPVASRPRSSPPGASRWTRRTPPASASPRPSSRCSGACSAPSSTTRCWPSASACSASRRRPARPSLADSAAGARARRRGRSRSCSTRRSSAGTASTSCSTSTRRCRRRAPCSTR